MKDADLNPNEKAESGLPVADACRPGSVFASLHPLTTAVYFLTTALFLVFFPHPVFSLAGILGGVALRGELSGRERLLRSLPGAAALFLLVALSNPLFSAEGETVLFCVSSLKITAESLLYGVNLAATLGATIVWFACFGALMTADKWMWIFGRLAPRLSMTLVISLRNLPLFFRQWKKVREAQQAVGYLSGGSPRERGVREIRTFSSLVSWALENAVDTAASMDARGYGLSSPGRSCFTLYRFDRRDALTLALCVLFGGGVVFSAVSGGLDFTFYPTLSLPGTGWVSILGYTSFAGLTLYPSLRERGEAILWHCLQSKI